MEARDWIAIAGILATATISVVSLAISAIRERRQQERKAEEDEKKRTYAPHIEFEIKTNFYGAGRKTAITEILITISNKGLVRQNFKDIRLRVRGIEQKQHLSFWEGREPRLEFPVKLVNDVSFLPGNYNFFFVEPGCEQTITYVTKIPTNVHYILAYAEFKYDRHTPHTTERVFPVVITTSQG